MKSTPRTKKIWHHFWLIQPILQFLGLLGILFVLSRCSPLAPSTDKASAIATADRANIVDNNVTSNVEKKRQSELLSDASDIPSLEANVLKENDYNTIASQDISVAAEDAINAAHSSTRKLKKLVEWHLESSQLELLASDGAAETTIDLSPFWRKLKAKDRDDLIQRLQDSINKQRLRAVPYVVTPQNVDKEISQVESITLEFKIKIIDENQAILVVRRKHPTGSNADVAEQMQIITIHAAKYVAVVLGE